MAVTKRQAEQAFRQFKQQFAAFIEDSDKYGPQLIHNWDWCASGPTKWAIVWEGGPYDWALLVEHGGTMEFGTVVPAAKHWPAGTFTEPVTGWAIGVYEV
jgi:hypothetical protein